MVRMPHEDALRWNQRYLKDDRFTTFLEPRTFLLQNAGLLPDKGLALDVAMGLGGNSAFLMQRGLRVLGVDISSVAVRRAHHHLPGLMVVVADLTNFYLPAAAFDVIVNFYYLQRGLWPVYRQALRPGGVLIFETLTTAMLAIQPDTDPAFLLQPGELRQAFDGWDILVYRENWVETRRGLKHPVASLVARRPEVD
jgi:tellurite methyltransferase